MNMTERKLVSIRKITAIKPIEGADKIQHYQIDDGWWVVSGIENFKVGDFCVYHEIDSFLPVDRPYYSWLENKAIDWNGRRGARIKTIRLKGALSQGLALPLKDFPEIFNPIAFGEGDYMPNIDGADVTALCGVVKWERIDNSVKNSNQKGNFPSDIPKTDQERIQNMFNVVDRSITYEVSKKMDGSSMTVFFEKDDVVVCSRNFIIDHTDSGVFAQATRLLGIDKIMKEKGSTQYVFQGELIGPGVNGNNHKLSAYEYHVFSVIDRERRVYLSPTLARRMCEHYGFKYVDVINTNKVFDFNSVDDCIQYAETVQDHEGVVFKMNKEIDLLDSSFKNYQSSFKIISNKYLLKNDL